MRCGLGLDGREEGEDDEMLICSIFQHVKGDLRPCEVLVVDGVPYWIRQITWLTFHVTISTDNHQTLGSIQSTAVGIMLK